MHKTFTRIIASFVILFGAYNNAAAQNNFFKDTLAPASQTRVIVPEKYRTLSLDTFSLIAFLQTSPSGNQSDPAIITIPMPDGTLARFRIWGSSIMEPGLAAKYPQLKTYTGQGIENQSAIIKIDWTELGFHAMILSSATTGQVFIDPYAQGQKTFYISYYKSDLKPDGAFIETGPIESYPSRSLNRQAFQLNNIPPSAPCIGSQLRTYRLAIACTHQYARAATGTSTPTVAQTLSAIITTINRIVGIYEEEVDISFHLVDSEDHIIFTSPSSDPLGAYNNNTSGLFIQGQAIIDANIGDANYDLGQTFSTAAGGGTANNSNTGNPGIVCVSNQKAHSAVGTSTPTGDGFNVDYVAHEIGHEFGAHHPFNSDMGSCGAPGQDYIGTNDEPGSGSTIMSYASGSDGSGFILCNSDNLQTHSNPFFNTINFDEITQYSASAGCGTVAAISNHPPVVNAGTDYTIPIKTPFVLTGSATDLEDNTLTYSWEQVDVGGNFCAWSAPLTTNEGDAPLFRSFPPVSTPVRYFPKLSDVINNTTTIGEILPTYSRTLHFRLTARDNHAGCGGVCYGQDAITVDGSSGPFLVTYPNAADITWYVDSMETVTWNPAGTQNAPVNCSNVVIQLSTDGGLTYPDTLLASAPNTGSAQIQVPNFITITARIRVMAAGNIFYDISNNNFAIVAKPVVWVVYPDPASATGTVNIVSNEALASVAVALFDATGRLVYRNNFSNAVAAQPIPIPLEGLAKGVYILKINSSNGSVAKKIVIGK